MKNLILLCFFSMTYVFSAFAQNADINIVPQPKSVKRLSGDFKLTYKTKIVARDETGRRSAGALNDLLMKNFGFKLEFVSDRKNPDNSIVFDDQKNLNTNPSEEAYGLNINKKGILISGKEAGQFYALQSLMQLIPVNFKGEAKLPAADISDAPRFGYRGMHLDVGRHFMPVVFVKKYIDLMAQYKFNEFHWHLTEDQGWRIEIKKYPRLTEIGSKRSESVKDRNLQPYIGDGVPVEGFYTQEQIKDVVAYAKERHINIIPEIELPGHSSAALTAYPNLGCRQNYNYKVQTTWGIFKEVYCPKEETFQFLEDVISEVIDLFPDSPYVHIGGDEVLKDFWKDSPDVEALKQKENLKDEHEVQSYFVRRMEQFVNSKGKKIIGWDEILEGGLAPNATVMSWRGEKGGVEAAKSHHNVIMTPNDYLYFDYGQGDPQYEPLNIGNYVPLEKVYSYDPQSKELTEEEKKYVIGAQANVWTEYLKTPDKVEYMVFPRIMALSEVVWSPVESKNYAGFLQRLQKQFQILDKENVNYRIPAPNGLQNVLLENGDTAKIDLKLPLINGKIFYTTDGSTPDEKSAEYKKPVEIKLKPNENVEFKTIVVNEKGRKSVVYAATIMRRQKLKAVDSTDKTQGINLRFYKGEFKSVKDFDVGQTAEISRAKSVMIQQFSDKTNKLKDPFGANFDGSIYVPEDGIYAFEVESGGGTVLSIGDETVVDLDGIHGSSKKTGLVPLSKGYYKINLRYFQNGGDAVLNIRWGLKGQGLRRINGSDLFLLVFYKQ